MADEIQNERELSWSKLPLPMKQSPPVLKKNAPYIARSGPVVNNKAVE